MNSVQKEMIRLYAKQLRLPTFNNYEKVIRQLSADDGYAQFLIELMKQELVSLQGMDAHLLLLNL